MPWSFDSKGYIMLIEVKVTCAESCKCYSRESLKQKIYDFNIFISDRAIGLLNKNQP